MAFPSTSVLDNFTGTNGTDLPVYSSNWQSAPTGGVNLEIQSNSATGTGAGSNNTNSWATDFGPDCEIYVTITTKPADGNILLLVARGVQTTSLGTIDGYCLRFAPAAGTDTLIIQRIDNGAQTNLIAPVSQEVINGDSLGLEIVGSTLTAYYKASGGAWTSIATVTDTTYSAAGKIGMLTSSTGVRLDDFGGGTYVTGGQTLTPSLFTNTNTFYNATVSATNALTPSLYTNTNTFYNATVTYSNTLTPALYTNTQTFYAPTISATYTITPDLFANTSTFYSANITYNNALTPNLFTNNQAFYSPTVSQGVTIEPSLYTNNQTFYSPSVTVGTVTLEPSLYTNVTVFYSATIEGGDAPQPTVSTISGVSSSFYKRRRIIIEREEEEEEEQEVIVQKVKRLIARKITNRQIAQKVQTQVIEQVQFQSIDLTQAQRLIDDLKQQEILARMRNKQMQDDEEAFLLLM